MAELDRASRATGESTPFKGRDATIRVLGGDQKAHRERPQMDGLVGRIGVQVDSLLRLGSLSIVNPIYYARM